MAAWGKGGSGVRIIYQCILEKESFLVPIRFVACEIIVCSCRAIYFADCNEIPCRCTLRIRNVAILALSQACWQIHLPLLAAICIYILVEHTRGQIHMHSSTNVQYGFFGCS